MSQKIKTYTENLIEASIDHLKRGYSGKPLNEQTSGQYKGVDYYNFPKSHKPHDSVVKSAEESGSDGIEHVHHKDGHSVQANTGDEHAIYHHIDDKGKHVGSYRYIHGTRGEATLPSHSEIKKSMPNSPDHIHKAIRNHIRDSI